MADHSVGARDESNESEASDALMFCFDNAFPVLLRCRFGPFLSPSLRVFVGQFVSVRSFLIATTT